MFLNGIGLHLSSKRLHSFSRHYDEAVRRNVFQLLIQYQNNSLQCFCCSWSLILICASISKKSAFFFYCLRQTIPQRYQLCQQFFLPQVFLHPTRLFGDRNIVLHTSSTRPMRQTSIHSQTFGNEQVISCWVVIIPIPLPQHQHAFKTSSLTKSVLVLRERNWCLEMNRSLTDWSCWSVSLFLYRRTT